MLRKYKEFLNTTKVGSAGEVRLLLLTLCAAQAYGRPVAVMLLCGSDLLESFTVGQGDAEAQAEPVR